MISAVCFTVPSAFISMICTAPLPEPPASPSRSAPAARSGMPSPSRSPRGATDLPKLSLASSRGPFSVLLLISTVRFIRPPMFIVPSEFIAPSPFSSRMCTAPALETPAASSFIAPTARSRTPLPSRSPRGATDIPKLSLPSSRGPFFVLLLITAVCFTVPSAFISMICTEPPPGPLSPMAPAARSGTPSPSRSPRGATDIPKLSLPCSRGPFSVLSLISTVETADALLLAYAVSGPNSSDMLWIPGVPTLSFRWPVPSLE